MIVKRKKKIKQITIVSILLFLALSFLLFFKTGLVIQLNGEKEIEIEVYTNYEELGARVLLPLDDLKISDNVKTNEIGTYEVNYDSFIAHKVRTVKVVDKTRPTLNLKGSSEMALPLTGKYVEPGYVANDNYDGDIADKVVISGAVDTSKAGEYILSYEVSDSSGNKIRERRIVTVLEDSPLTAGLKDFDLSNVFPETILKYTDEDTSLNEEELVFFGDSIIGNLGFYHCIDINEHFWTRSSMTPENIYERIINIYCQGVSNFMDELKSHQPSDILILIGTVMVSDSSIEYFVQSYEEYIQKMLEISPNTHYIIMSLLPVCEELENSEGRNDKINKINYYLCQLCEKYGLDFMNAAEGLKDENGALKRELAQDDLIHPNVEGSKVLADYIRHHLSY